MGKPRDLKLFDLFFHKEGRLTLDMYSELDFVSNAMAHLMSTQKSVRDMIKNAVITYLSMPDADWSVFDDIVAAFEEETDKKGDDSDLSLLTKWAMNDKTKIS